MGGIRMNWSKADLDRMVKEGKLQGYTVMNDTKKLEELLKGQEEPKKRSKFGSKVETTDGIRFDSKKEAKRYHQLLNMRKAGLIGQLRLQVPYELNEGGSHSLKYIADFVYIDAVTGEEVVEDSKGFRTREYKKKKRLMKEIHNITIREV